MIKCLAFQRHYTNCNYDAEIKPHYHGFVNHTKTATSNSCLIASTMWHLRKKYSRRLCWQLFT